MTLAERAALQSYLARTVLEVRAHDALVRSNALSLERVARMITEAVAKVEQEKRDGG